MKETVFSYKVESHHNTDEKGFALVRLKLLGHTSGETHPDNWYFEMLVRKEELNQWELGSFKRIGVVERKVN